MLKLINTTGGSLTASQTIPLSVKYNTNPNTSFDTTTNTITINKAGMYKIDAMFVIASTSVATISIDMYADGVIVPEAKATEDFAEIGDNHTFTIVDSERVSKTLLLTDKATISFAIDTASTLVSANVQVIEIK